MIIVVFSPRKDDKTKRRQNDKTPKRQNATRKDDKYNPLICVLSSFRGEKTTFIVLSSCRSVVFSRRKDDNTTKRRAKRRQIRSLISGLCLSSFRLYFVVLSTFRFVVFSGRKYNNYRFGVLSSFRGEKTIIQQNAKQKDDKLGR